MIDICSLCGNTIYPSDERVSRLGDLAHYECSEEAGWDEDENPKEETIITEDEDSQ